MLMEMSRNFSKPIVGKYFWVQDTPFYWSIFITKSKLKIVQKIRTMMKDLETVTTGNTVREL